VRQGDVIGYVGQTGWATGPHLDYRIKKNGTWVNPTKLSLPPAAPLAKERMPEFLERVALYDGRMEAEPAESATLALDGGD
jgi:hypothetical protein